MLDDPKEGYYGGQVAGPIFKEIAERSANYLNLKPDIDDSTPRPDVIAQADRLNKPVLRPQ